MSTSYYTKTVVKWEHWRNYIEGLKKKNHFRLMFVITGTGSINSGFAEAEQTIYENWSEDELYWYNDISMSCFKTLTNCII